MLSEFPIIIPGIPVPQGSHAVSRSGHVYDSNRGLKPWRETMSNALTAWTGTWFGAWEPFDGPLLVDVTFHMPKPKRPKYSLPAVKPDADKLCRALGDAMQSSGLIREDSRITTWHARKRYSDTPGITIHDIREDTL